MLLKVPIGFSCIEINTDKRRATSRAGKNGVAEGCLEFDTL
jgi:hypothetical protein